MYASSNSSSSTKGTFKMMRETTLDPCVSAKWLDGAVIESVQVLVDDETGVCQVGIVTERGLVEIQGKTESLRIGVCPIVKLDRD